MSIRSSITRSKDDLLPIEKKSYKDVILKVEILDAKEFIEQDSKEDMRKRLYDREYSVDKVPYIFKLSNKSKENITVNQIKDLFDDIGFNTDTTISDVFGSDIMLVYNIGGFLIPFYSKIVPKLFKQSKYKALYLTKLSPGKKRLHCRIYHGSDGSWYLTSHVDAANWLNLINPFEIVKSHLQKGTGDYDMGITIMSRVFDIVVERLEKRKRLFIDIQEIYKEIKDEK